MESVPPDFRAAIAAYIEQQAEPKDKFSHQPRLYLLAKRLGEGRVYDDDILYAAAWLHDLGVFFGHRPKDPTELALWDNVAYAVRIVPELLNTFGFPAEKAKAVAEAIRTHQPSQRPTSAEGELLRDADILEQLGVAGIVRTISKVGRDTRFRTHGDALRSLRRSANELPSLLHLERAQEMAKPRLALVMALLEAAEAEGGIAAF